MMTINFEDTIHITPIPDGVSEQEFESEVSRIDGRINVIEASSDVTDVVGTYSDLENYDTSTLTDNDIIKVLEDSTHDDAISYYRWSTTSETFSFIGSLGPFASEDYVDTTFANKDLSNLSTQGGARLHALKGYEDAGELLTDAEGLADVKSYAHSTFDKSKFTKIGSANIADDGVVVMSTSGTQNSNYLKASYSLLDLKDKSWNVKVRFYNSSDATTDRYNILKFGTTKSSSICYRKADKRLDFYYSTGTSEEFVSDKGKNFTMPNDFNYVDASYAYNAQSGEYTFSYVTDNNTNDSYSVTPTTTNKGLYNINTASASDVITIGQGQSGTQYDCIYPIDLKYFSVTNDGVEVFSGNKTGIDTYTIGGDTVTIPYTLSKTGSKIVDSAYRTQVNAVYNEFGYAPYYTLSGTDFTLPQGEVYGMIERKMPNTTAIVTISQTDYNNLTVVDPNTLYVITGV